ncbi:MAG: type II secretion system protein [Halanaerobiales bacterium]|nr:type II secretion system protein [Halanaerobiales bacterium]
MYCKKGFTIIELLVTLAILGILVVSVIPVLTGVEKKAKDSSISQVAASIRSGMEAYHQMNSAYPLQSQISSWEDLDIKLEVIELGQKE